MITTRRGAGTRALGDETERLGARRGPSTSSIILCPPALLSLSPSSLVLACPHVAPTEQSRRAPAQARAPFALKPLKAGNAPDQRRKGESFATVDPVAAYTDYHRASSNQRNPFLLPAPRRQWLQLQVSLVLQFRDLTTHTQSHKVRKLGSFSTPGFNKVKPQPLNYPSAADNSISYVNVSSTESTPLNASTSSIPIKRQSSGSSEGLAPPSPPKRPKTAHLPNKENIFHADSGKDKGKGRAREPPRSSAPPAGSVQPPVTTFLSNVQSSSSRGKATTLRATWEALPIDVDLHEVGKHLLPPSAIPQLT